MALGDNNERQQNSSSQGKSTTKSRRKKIMSTLSPSHSSIPPLHPPSQGPLPFSHSLYGMPPQGYNSMLPQGYSPMPPPGYSSIPPQGYSGMPSTTPFYNMLPGSSSSMPPPLISTHGMHSAYLAAMDRRPSPNTPLSEANEPVSPQTSRLNKGSNSSPTSPNRSSTLSSVDGPDLPSPGKLVHQRKVRIIADGQGFYPSRPAANAISAGIRKIYDGYYRTWSDVPYHVQQGIFNEFMEAFLGRPATRDEVWKKTHMKIKDGKEVWVEARAEDTYNRYIQAMKELTRSKPTDEQGNQIMPSEEESISCWLDVVGGVYKGRAYGLCFEKNFHRLQCGLQRIGGSATMPNDLLAEMQ